MKLTFAVLLFSVFCSAVAAAPFPGMGSSKLMSHQNEILLGHFGLTMDLKIETWLQDAIDHEVREKGFRWRSKRTQGQLSLRIEDSEKDSNLESYSRKWLREYSLYGFQILASQKMEISKHPAFVIDLLQLEQQKQIRQVIMLKNGKVAILSCHNSPQEFKSTLDECNKAFSSFQWLK